MNNHELTLQDFFRNFRQFADSKTAYSFAKWLYKDYLKEPEPYFIENGKIVFDEYTSGEGSGYITPELGQYDGDGEYFIRWCVA